MLTCQSRLISSVTAFGNSFFFPVRKAEAVSHSCPFPVFVVKWQKYLESVFHFSYVYLKMGHPKWNFFCWMKTRSQLFFCFVFLGSNWFQNILKCRSCGILKLCMSEKTDINVQWLKHVFPAVTSEDFFFYLSLLRRNHICFFICLTNVSTWYSCTFP